MAGSTVGKLLIEIGVDPKALTKGLKQAERSMMQFSNKMENVGRTLSTAVTLPILGIGVAALKSFGDFEKLEKGMVAIMGSSKAAGEELKKLQKSAEAPGLGFEQAVAGSIRLQAVGMSADEARKTLEEFGNAIATTGGGAEDLDQVTRQLTQMISKNRILQEDFMVLQERMPMVSQAMQSAFGHSNIELIRKSGMGAREFVARLTEEMSKFDRVEGGFSNSFENMAMAAKMAMAQIGESINKSFDVTGKMEQFAAWIQRAADWFDGLSDSTKKLIIVSAAFAATLGPVAMGIATMTKVIVTLASPVGLAVTLLVALAAAAVWAYTKFETFRGVVNALKDGMIEIIQVFGEAVSAFFRGFDELKKGNINKAGLAFTEALLKSNPITVALTQGKRIASAFSGGYEKGIAEKVESFNPFKDKDKIMADATATGQQAGAAMAEGIAAGASDGITGFKGVDSFNAIWAGKGVPSGPVQSMGAPTGDLSGALAALKKGNDATYTWMDNFDRFRDKVKGFTDGFVESIYILNDVMAQFFANKSAAIDADYAKQKAAIDGSRLSEEAKARALQHLDEETEKKRRKIRRQQAIQEKMMAIFSATINAASAVVNALSKDPSGALAIIVGALSAVQIGLIASQKIPALAKGGLAYGPQMAMVGDNPGARVDPEVIAPLSKLQAMMGMGGGKQEIVMKPIVISGRDILLVQERAAQDRQRTRGF